MQKNASAAGASLRIPLGNSPRSSKLPSRLEDHIPFKSSPY